MSPKKIQNYYKSQKGLQFLLLIEKIWYVNADRNSIEESGWENLFAKLLTPLLILLSYLYRLAGFLRKKFITTQNILPPLAKADSKPAEIKTVVIGNITAGGSGKTPFIIALVQLLYQKNIKVGIISHGYLAKKQKPSEVMADGDSQTFGDEALLLKKTFSSYSHLPVFIGRPRIESAKKLLSQYPQTQIILFDDGLQDPSFYRDLEIVLVSEESLGNKRFIPAGPLRESINRIAQTSEYSKKRLVFHSDKASSEKRIKAQVSGAYPLADFGKAVDEVNLKTLAHYAQSKTNWLFFAAFARPWRLSATIKNLEVSLYEFFYPDHFPLNGNEINRRLQDVPPEISKNALIILSQKDAVKVLLDESYKNISANIPIVVIDYSLKIPEEVVGEIIQSLEINV